uniref:thioredoxin domain-containing protein 6 isoform X17 n=1 Tax=Ictidomys tridecemlineatus TaxID=43179 RepID=UPI001A9EA643|nr:thioredoxin domain-containing protein 6 isoform X17 [Ictidomys tridecemlineatus]XP_040125810.1 thioredoxin domain-containing protein 6 isoform X17 [Ictidomys tridecemlineatus]XP_040125811.1 thioredoxin domain-containing protein 6 isoform X17 [Ictidomys tridecemlineatus]
MGSKKKEIALQGGELVAVVRGANAPLLEKTILDQLEAEKKVLAEGRERKVSLLNACEKRQTLTFKISMNFLVLPVTLHPATKKDLIKDEALSDEDEYFLHEKNVGEDEDVALHSSSLTAEASTHFHSWATWLASEDSWESVSSEKTCTLAIIKPDAVVHGKTDEIIMKIQEAGFDILTNEERTMTEAEMRLFYQHRAGEEAFEKLVHHMCSGPSHLLILTRTKDSEDVITAWRTLMGPCDPCVARREQPESLRALYGTEMPFNAVHGSRDREDASRELALLFPSVKFSDEDVEAPQGGGSGGPNTGGNGVMLVGSGHL